MNEPPIKQIEPEPEPESSPWVALASSTSTASVSGEGQVIHPTSGKEDAVGERTPRPQSEPEQERREPSNSQPGRFMEFLTPSACAAWEMPPDYILCGDAHLTRGGVAVIGGPAGCGKSRSIGALAIAGATGQRWMGMDTHSQFKTMIVQVENGMARLKSEFTDIILGARINLDPWVRVTPPPRYGIPLSDPEFRSELAAVILDFEPGVLVFDPWNRMTMDEKAKDYRQTIDWILEALPEDSSSRPAVVIVAHTRKLGSGEARKRGRDLLQELSGSLVIGSAARSVMILEPASQDPEDDRVVWTCAKNNDGREGPPSAWHRRNGMFSPCEDFDFEAFYGGGKEHRAKVTDADIERALATPKTRKDAAQNLEDITGCSQSTAYEALRPDGKFSHLISLAGSLLSLR